MNHIEMRRPGKRVNAFLVALILLLFLTTQPASPTGTVTVLRISNWETGEVYVEAPARPGDTLFFGWIHSLEKIPWNEYYHISPNLNLILDSITFPAFGAGIPENKGKVCRVADGLIYMEQIDQTFEEFVWLNSHFATQEICLNGVEITRGSSLPEHTRLRLAIERSDRYER